MRRARGSAFLSEINPTAGPIATGRREQLTQGPDKDRNAQPATDILGPGRLGHHVVASCGRSEEHTSELQSLMRISYAVFCLKKKNNITKIPIIQCIHTQHPLNRT